MFARRPSTRDAAVGIQTFVRLSVLAARRQTPTLTWEGAVSVRKKATQSSDGVLYGITYSADASEIVLISEIFFITRLGCCSCAQHATVSAGSLPLVFHPGGSQAGWGSAAQRCYRAPCGSSILPPAKGGVLRRREGGALNRRSHLMRKAGGKGR